MINILYKLVHKSPIQLQLNSFLEWKSQIVENIAGHKLILLEFIKILNIQDISQVQHNELEKYLSYLRGIGSGQGYSTWSKMKTIKSFLTYSYRRGNRCISPSLVRIGFNGGVTLLKNVDEKSIMPTTNTMKKPLGRPASVEYIEKVKLLRDSGGLSFRQISRAINKDVAQVHVWYKYPISKLISHKEMLRKRISTGEGLH